MVETVVSYKLPVSEHLVIQKNRFLPEDGKQNIGRISIVTGIHGDELEGQYICYEIVRRMKQHPEYLNGTVDIYPALNPLGIDSATRDIPKLNMDMNRMFPGSVKGTMMDKAAAKIVEDIIYNILEKKCIVICQIKMEVHHVKHLLLVKFMQIRLQKMLQNLHIKENTKEE